jgi:hypothetical protein
MSVASYLLKYEVLDVNRMQDLLSASINPSVFVAWWQYISAQYLLYKSTLSSFQLLLPVSCRTRCQWALQDIRKMTNRMSSYDDTVLECTAIEA